MNPTTIGKVNDHYTANRLKEKRGLGSECHYEIKQQLNLSVKTITSSNLTYPFINGSNNRISSTNLEPY